MSEYRGPVADWTFIAGADLRTARYRVVKHHTTSGEVVLCEANAGSTPTVGVLQNAPNTGEQALVRIWGGSKLYVDGTTDIAAGDFLTASTGGKAIKAGSDKDKCVAIAVRPYTDTTVLLAEVFVNVQFYTV
jgi:hypothetical protein